MRRGRGRTRRGETERAALASGGRDALCERHDALDPTHRLYDLAAAADGDAPGVDVSAFRRRFRSLVDDPTESEHRKALVDLTRAYADSETTDGPAAD